jgi:hypothetical protein
METAEVPQALQHTWSGHARTHVSERYKKLLRQREWRLEWADKVGIRFEFPAHSRRHLFTFILKLRRIGTAVTQLMRLRHNIA